MVLALQNPELYENIARKTRARYESNRPRAVLFEGPPGTGKTLSARIIAQQAGIPMIHIPIESVVSKWYGDSEKKMSSIFDACEKLDGAIIFIDEVRSCTLKKRRLIASDSLSVILFIRRSMRWLEIVLAV